jgi:hypothetical protein
MERGSGEAFIVRACVTPEAIVRAGWLLPRTTSSAGRPVSCSSCGRERRRGVAGADDRCDRRVARHGRLLSPAADEASKHHVASARAAAPTIGRPPAAVASRDDHAVLGAASFCNAPRMQGSGAVHDMAPHRPEHEPASRASDVMLCDLDAEALSSAPTRWVAALAISRPSDSATNADVRAIAVRPYTAIAQRSRERV